MIILKEHLETIAGQKTKLMSILPEWINTICPEFGIDTPREYAHFLAQACHETDHFRTLEEYASGKEYEGRKDLGNVIIGDGVRFKGRGIFQTTGRANYKQLGVKKGNPDLFLKNPELLEQPEYAVWSACVFWKTRNLIDVSNNDDSVLLSKKYKGHIIKVPPVEYISITINGGRNGLEDRKKFYERAKKIFSA